MRSLYQRYALIKSIIFRIDPHEPLLNQKRELYRSPVLHEIVLEETGILQLPIAACQFL